VRSPEELDKTFADVARGGRGRTCYHARITVWRYECEAGLRICGKSRLPSISNETAFVESGGLAVYAEDRSYNYRRAATYVDKILKGAKPADLPVEQPTKFELIINLKTAKQIGLTIPSRVLARADKVIK
jgi:putative ABC transport system substrate-binding protein